MTTSASASDRAQQAASTAADEGRHVAGTAKEEAQNVASATAEQARNLVQEAVGQATDQLGQQTSTQRDRLVKTLRSVGDDLDQMTQGGGPGLARDAAREVADRTRSLGSYLDGREPGQLLDDVRDFARRRPAAFLLGALAAGAVAGRLVRGATDGVAAAAVADPTGGQGDAETISERRPDVTAGMLDAPTVPSPPIPPSAPEQPTIQAHGDARDEFSPMGTPAAGYGDRPALGDQP